METHWDPFTGCTDEQRRLIVAYERLLLDANERVNLISRSSSSDVRARHITHSLSLTAKRFPDGASVVDWGSGGGLPGIPLAICFPDVRFHLVESILKKTRAMEHIVEELELRNVFVHRMRAEDWKEPFDFAVSRATAPLLTLWMWTKRYLRPGKPGPSEFWPHGLLALKGGDLTEEISELRLRFPGVRIEQLDLESIDRDRMVGKRIVVVQRAAKK